MRRDEREAVRAAQAMADMHVFQAIIKILEGGTVHAPSYAVADRIIKACERQQGRLLKSYDCALARLIVSEVKKPKRRKE